MKNAFKLLALFLFLISGCDIDDGSSFAILSQAKHPESNYRIVIEDYTYYFWASFYETNALSPLCSCFVGTTRAPLKEAEMPAPFNGNPPISEQYASKQATINSDLKGSIQFRWSNDGKVVVVFVKESPVCMLDGVQRNSYSKAVKEAGSYGIPWDKAVFLTKMKGAI